MCFKGIVMELSDQYAIVMKDDGSMVRINIKDSLKIGMCILFTKEDIYSSEKNMIKEKNNKWIRQLVLVALVVLLFICPLRIMKKFTSIYAVLTIDINPSLELKIDKNKRIVKVDELNDDAYKVDIDELKGLNLDQGINLLKEMILNSEDIANKNCVLVGFSFLEDIEDSNFEKDIQETIKDSFDNFNIVYLKANQDDIDSARLKGVSLGRYEASKELKEELNENLAGKISISDLFELLEKHSNSNRCEKEVINEIKHKLKEEVKEHNESDDKDEENDDLEKEGSDEDDELDHEDKGNEESTIVPNDDLLENIKKNESYEVKDDAYLNNKDIDSNKDLNNKDLNNKEKYESDENDESDDLHEDESDDEDEEHNDDNHEEDDD